MRKPEGGLRRRFGFTGGVRICCLLAWDVADQQSVACSRPGWAVPHDPWVLFSRPLEGPCFRRGINNAGVDPR
jgi:hypothetical protein